MYNGAKRKRDSNEQLNISLQKEQSTLFCDNVYDVDKKKEQNSLQQQNFVLQKPIYPNLKVKKKNVEQEISLVLSIKVIKFSMTFIIWRLKSIHCLSLPFVIAITITVLCALILTISCI